MTPFKLKINNYLLYLLSLVIFSCESDPVSVDSSFSNNNSFFMQSFEIDIESSNTFQDESLQTGNSYRLYSGNIGDINSKVLMRINTSHLANSKYCMENDTAYTDSTIHSVDSLKIIFRSFDELMDEDSLILYDINSLNISGGFSEIDGWDEDSLSIFSTIELATALEPIDNLSIETESYTIRLTLPFNTDWCSSQENYYIDISYTPETSHEFQCLELTSSQYSSGISDSYRPSLAFAYNEFNEIIDYVDRFSLLDAGYDFLMEQVYYVYNDTLSTKSKIFMIRNMPEGFNDTINNQEMYLNNFPISSSIFEPDTYELELLLDVNQDILDSISTIDFIIDSIIVVADDLDPSQDNNSEGGEGNGSFDQLGDSTELFIDLGFDLCPDLYESGLDNSCLCDFINAPESCNDILDEDLIYNEEGTEGNGYHDQGEEFPDSADIGIDGCPDVREGGLNEQGNTTCLEEDNPDYQGGDPNADNYMLDPSNDDWSDCGEDGLCDEDEEGFDLENNPDPSNDNWGSDNLNGTEGNSVWDEGEGKEGNGQYDFGEPFYDWGIDGIPEANELSCSNCIDDLDTENNNVYDFGEAFQDTGPADSLFSVDEDGYNPNGTEGNGVHNDGETFPVDFDCGEDGDCNDGDTSDDHNIDPNNDNWLDCGSDSDCDIEDEDGSQGNNLWEVGEGYQDNGQYDSYDNQNEFYYDWGFDQLPDSLEALASSNLLTYSAPTTITYTIDQDLNDIDNDLDTDKDIIFDINSINDGDSQLNISLSITANKSFKAIQFRLNHSPYINQTIELIHKDDIIRKIDQNEIIEDISDYDNTFYSYDFSNDSTLVLDYFNGIRFSLNFNQLGDFINQNPGIHINESYTTLGLYLLHEHSNYNFFDNQINLWVDSGYDNKFLGTVSASSNDEILIPFAHVLQDFVEGNYNLSDSLVFFLDGVYDNRSRLVMHKDSDLFSPKLEVFYSK